MSKIEVDAIDKQSGSTLTIGGSGTAVTLACGATQSGFGRTGTVDWDTTPKTATFTAVAGDGFFCNTESGGFTVNLPAGVAGAIVSLADYAATWNTNNLTVSPNGTDKIGGVNVDLILDTQGQSVTFVFVDSTQGWLNVQDSTSNERAATFITATGGTITNCGNFKIHTFTGPGTFCVSAISTTSAENTVGYAVVAGGGGGGYSGDGHQAGGGGAGGFREGRNAPIDNFTASPLVANAPTNAVTLTVQGYPITVGGGGTGSTSQPTKGGDGNNSIFSTITSALGGGGGTGSNSSSVRDGNDGGSGGGSAGSGLPADAGGAGNTPSVSPPQGQNGGAGTQNPGQGGSGGGAGEAGDTSPSNTVTNPGGPGVATSITGSPLTKSVGGPSVGAGPGPAASANTGSGGSGASSGGGAAGPHNGGNGGSGVVIIRYKFQ